MAISTTRLSEILATLSTYETRYELVHMLLLESLSPQQRKFYELVANNDPLPINARDVMNWYPTSLQNASTVLKELYDWGLLTREKIVDDQGIVYEYRVIAH